MECFECKHLLKIKYKDGSVKYLCTLIGGIHTNMLECSHFEERPKDNSKHFDEAKQTANKGKPPRKQPKKKPGELGYARQVRKDIKKNLPKEPIFNTSSR